MASARVTAPSAAARVNAGIVFPKSAGIRIPRSDVLMLSSGLLFLLSEIVEHAGFALLA